MKPAPLSKADLSKVRAVFTDVDGTLTSKGKLLASTVRAIEWLVAHRVQVALVSGRPAGWGECWARLLPVAAVIVENGGVTFVPRKGGGLERRYAEGPGERLTNRKKLLGLVEGVRKAVPGAELSFDSAYTEVDLAIDYNEDVKLGNAAADRIEAHLRGKGAKAVRSSVHVNTWLGDFDKRTAVEAFLLSHWGTVLQPGDRRFVYVGDSFNDAPLFEAFALSVGVANVADVLERLEHPPKFVTRTREGKGFGELADAVVRARKRRA